MREPVSILTQAAARSADTSAPHSERAAEPDAGPVAPRGSRRGSGPVTKWERRYRTVVVLSDAVAVFGIVALAGLLGLTGVVDGLHPALAPVVAAAVLVSLLVRRAWAVQVLGDGAEEYRRLGAAVFSAAVVVALIGPWFERLDVRPWLLVVLPAIALFALVARYALRQWLHRSRRAGRRMLPVVVAGGAESVRDLIERTREHSHVGWRVEAACVVGAQEHPAGEIDGVPVIGSLDQLADQVRRGGYRVVAITPDEQWTPEVLRRLAWDLEGTSAELAVAPVLLEVAGPRVDVSGVLGMPMLRVSQPAFTGGRRLVKEVVDRVGALLALVLASPVLLAAAVAIKLGDGGPVCYRQLRVKRDGEVFAMWKLRTMHVGADRLRDELPSDADGPLFKLRSDPRVTRVGATLRRYSLDELPQLLNVLTGSMSLVGPRPPLLEETHSYGPDTGRRLLVKPGMTGLWQVSGRSDLSWEDSVRLDLRYVEDWSLALDAAILWKTIRAVLSGRGAY